ncbi:MAG: FkbM family methyltransferase [Thermoproteus sp.]
MMTFKQVALDYFKLRPIGFTNAISLYAAFTKGFVFYLLHHNKFITIGQFLKKDVIIKHDGMILFARAKSDDIVHYSYSAKPWTHKWFKPRKGEVVVDCGSSVGAFTMMALKMGATVYAFEPEPSTFMVLRRNIEINNFSSAVVKNKALSNRSGTFTFYAPKHFTGTSSFNKDWVKTVEKLDEVSEINVEVTTLDEELKDLSVINWLLIDVEGHELELLKGSIQTLKITENIIIEISHKNREEVLKILHENHFIEIEHGDPEKKIQYFFFRRGTS